MKELKRTKTVEEIFGYEAEDGTFFNDKAECEKYEATAKAVIYKEFKKLMVGEPFPECHIWESFGYGSEEYMLVIIEIKDANDVHTANMFSESVSGCFTFTNEHIGKRFLVNLGYSYDSECALCPRTEDSLINQFTKEIQLFFRPESVEKGDK